MSKAPSRPAFPSRSVNGGLVAFAILLALFWFSELDRNVANSFYQQSPPWPGQHLDWCLALYRYGQWPATLTGLGGGIAFGLSFAQPRWRRWRGPGLFLFLLLALGPGLLVNGLTKALAGRPRPEETLYFGGLWPFHRPFELGIPGQGQSLVSGHVANTFYFFGLIWLLRPSRRFWVFLLVSATGLAMTWTRAAQGAHWLSDGLLAGALLFTLAAALSPLIHWQPSRRVFRRPDLRWALGLGALAWLFISHVRYEDRRFIVEMSAPGLRPSVLAPQERRLDWAQSAPPSDVAVELNFSHSDLRLSFDQAVDAARMPLALNAQFWGQGLPGARESLTAQSLDADSPMHPGPQTLGLRFDEAQKGLWFVTRASADLALPRALPVDARLRLSRGRITIGPFPQGRRVLINHLPHESAPPGGFQPFGNSAWLREGSDPLISLDLQAPEVRFEEP